MTATCKGCGVDLHEGGVDSQDPQGHNPAFCSVECEEMYADRIVERRRAILSKLSVADRYELQEIDKDLPEGDDYLPGGRLYDDEQYITASMINEEPIEDNEYWDKEIAKQRAKEKRQGF